MQNIFKYYDQRFLVVFLLSISGLVGMITSELPSNISSYPLLSAPFLLSLCFIVIDKFLWKYLPFKWLISVPNIAGKYEGHIYFINPITKKKGSKKCVMEIHQIASDIKIHARFLPNKVDEEETQSKSIMVNIFPSGDSFDIVFNYENAGTPHSGKYPKHSGVNYLSLIKNDDEIILKGYYYTNRTPQTRGEMKVKLVQH